MEEMTIEELKILLKSLEKIIEYNHEFNVSTYVPAIKATHSKVKKVVWDRLMAQI